MVLKLPWAQEGMLWVFEKVLFQLFFKVLRDEVETIFWESEVKHSKLLNQNVVIGSFFYIDL